MNNNEIETLVDYNRKALQKTLSRIFLITGLIYFVLIVYDFIFLILMPFAYIFVVKFIQWSYWQSDVIVAEKIGYYPMMEYLHKLPEGKDRYIFTTKFLRSIERPLNLFLAYNPHPSCRIENLQKRYPKFLKENKP